MSMDMQNYIYSVNVPGPKFLIDTVKVTGHVLVLPRECTCDIKQSELKLKSNFTLLHSDANMENICVALNHGLLIVIVPKVGVDFPYTCGNVVSDSGRYGVPGNSKEHRARLFAEHPSNAWVDSEREETSIYPKDWIDDLQGMDAWQDCPWFLDYADGEFPDVEEGAYHAHHKKVKGKGNSSSATINQPKDTHSPSTAKGRPPRTAKGRPSTSKKRPHPAVSESSESLKEQFKLLSREDSEDSRHADSEQQSDSRWSSPSGRSRGLQDIHKLLGSLSYTRQMDPNARLGGVRFMWADLPTHCKVDARFGGVPLWNVFTDGIVQSVFTIAAEFLLDDGCLVVVCRAEHLFKVISKAREFQFRYIRTLFLRMPSHTYVMDYDFTDPVATLIVAMFVRDLDGPLPVPFYDPRAGDIAADIDGYEADSDML
ncbi:hypothetical protein L7F22_048416 [Adiantum nelumboides]|nr:hypothetical protein [Adiantum nelumboides]